VVGRNPDKLQVADDFDRLDIVVNNAGTNIRKPVQELSLTEWHTVLDTHLTSAFLCSRAAYPHLKARGGKLINIGSMTSILAPRLPRPTVPARAASCS